MPEIEKLLSEIAHSIPPAEAFFLDAGVSRYRRSRQFSALRELGLHNFDQIEVSGPLVAGLALYEAGNVQQAFKYYTIAANAPETRSIATILMANGLKERGNNRAAIAQYMRVPLDALSSHLRGAVFKGLSSAHRDTGNPERARDFIDKALNCDPDNYRFWFSKAFLYHHAPALGDGKRDNISFAVEYYGECISHGGKDWSAAHLHLALVHALLGGGRELVSEISYALELFQTNPTSFDALNRSLALLLMNSFEDAIQELENSIFRFNFDSVSCALKNARLLLTVPDIEIAMSTQIARYSKVLEGRLEDLRIRDLYQEGEWRASGANIATQTHTAIVAFIDVRGFTNWLFKKSKIYPTVDISSDVAGIYNLSWEMLRDNMTYCKFVGDGLMVIQRIYGTDEDALTGQVQSFLESLKRLFSSFASLNLGDDEKLSIGIGVSVGSVIRLSTHKGNCDYIGSTVNVAARLCNEARPSGIVIALTGVEKSEFGVTEELLRNCVDVTFPNSVARKSSELKGFEGLELQLAAWPPL